MDQGERRFHKRSKEGPAGSRKEVRAGLSPMVMKRGFYGKLSFKREKIRQGSGAFRAVSKHWRRWMNKLSNPHTLSELRSARVVGISLIKLW